MTRAFVLLLGFVVMPIGNAFGTPVKRAVLVGIGKYKKPTIPTLSGPVNDVELMKNLLVGKFDFAPENVCVLTNEKATRAAILDAVRTQLIEASQPGDIAVFHFSGHGSQVTDVSGDEDDHLDETIVPYDSRQGDVFDITDDEINGLLRELTQKKPTVSVVFILDSCHSGTSARGGVREIPADTRIPPAPTIGRGTAEKERDFFLASARYVEVAACQPHQLAREYSFGGTTYGLLTYSIVQALRASPDPMTYRDLKNQLDSTFSSRTTTQQAHIEGTGLDAIVFNDRFILRSPTVQVEPDGRARATVAAGLVYGMDAGTRLRVYPAGAVDFSPEKATATIRLTTVAALSSTAVVQSGTISPHDRAVVELLQKPGFTFRVGLTHLPAALRGDVAAALSPYEAVKIVTEEPFDVTATKAPRGSIVLSSADGSLSKRLPSSASATCIAREIANWGRWLAILALDSGASPLQIDVNVSRASDSAEQQVAQVADGDTVKVTVTNRSIKSIYVIVLDLASDLTEATLYPPAEIGDVVKPGGHVEAQITASLPAGRDEAVDHIKIIAVVMQDNAPAERQLSPTVFQLQPCDQPELGARAGENDLEAFLRLASRGQRGPGVLIEAWTTRHRLLAVKKRK